MTTEDSFTTHVINNAYSSSNSNNVAAQHVAVAGTSTAEGRRLSVDSSKSKSCSLLARLSERANQRSCIVGMTKKHVLVARLPFCFDPILFSNFIEPSRQAKMSYESEKVRGEIGSSIDQQRRDRLITEERGGKLTPFRVEQRDWWIGGVRWLGGRRQEGV